MLYIKRRAPEKGEGEQRGARLHNCLGGALEAGVQGHPWGLGPRCFHKHLCVTAVHGQAEPLV